MSGVEGSEEACRALELPDLEQLVQLVEGSVPKLRCACWAAWEHSSASMHVAWTAHSQLPPLPPARRDVLTERRIEAARSEMARGAAEPLTCIVCCARPRDTFLNWSVHGSASAALCSFLPALARQPPRYRLQPPSALQRPPHLPGVQPAHGGLPRVPGAHHQPDAGVCVTLAAEGRLHVAAAWKRAKSGPANHCNKPGVHAQQRPHLLAAAPPGAGRAPLLLLLLSWKEEPTATSSVWVCSPAGWSCRKCTRHSRWCWSRVSR